jgi:hypothetical protein
MRKLAVGIVALMLVASSAFADDLTCSARATDKKLAGAAKNSFMKKCQSDAKATCEGQAKDKKLAGAAKNSFMKKCVSDAVGAG